MEALKAPSQVSQTVDKHDRMNLRFGASAGALIFWLLAGWCFFAFFNAVMESDHLASVKSPEDRHEQEISSIRLAICAAGFGIIAICFSINFKLAGILQATKIAESRGEAANAKTEQLLASIAAELTWQRQQKEKEITRAKAAQSANSKSPS